ERFSISTEVRDCSDHDQRADNGRREHEAAHWIPLKLASLAIRRRPCQQRQIAEPPGPERNDRDGNDEEAGERSQNSRRRYGSKKTAEGGPAQRPDHSGAMRVM